MELNDKVTQMEDELKILKNELQAVLLDLRESFLNRENPFNQIAASLATAPIVINNPGQPEAAGGDPQAAPTASAEPVPATAVEEPAPETPTSTPPPDEVNDMPPTQPSDRIPPDDSIDGRALSMSDLDGPVIEPLLVEPAHREKIAAADDLAPEEVIRAWRPVEGNNGAGNGSHGGNNGAGNGSGAKMDLATISRLAGWVTESVRRLGGERTVAILDIAALMGYVDPDLKEILAKFVSPLPGESSIRPTTRDYLATLVELDKLLGRDSRSEVALLSILCQAQDNG